MRDFFVFFFVHVAVNYQFDKLFSGQFMHTIVSMCNVYSRVIIKTNEIFTNDKCLSRVQNIFFPIRFLICCCSRRKKDGWKKIL